MTTHIKAFTYEPKIAAVLAGTCCQTIRFKGKSPVSVGDKILFHGWSGRPYRSKWSWRKTVTVNSVWDVTIERRGIWYMTLGTPVRIGWDREWADEIAQKDGIWPPTGMELKRVLEKMHGLKEPTEFQIIRWKGGSEQ